MIQTFENTTTSEISRSTRLLVVPGSGRVLNLIGVIKAGDDVGRAIDICGARRANIRVASNRC